MPHRRRRIKQSTSLEERLAAQSQRLREEAKSLPQGKERDRAIRKARLAETGSHINVWLRSPRLKAPT
ncbi:hypothetical protein M2232_009305 [Bradyrhizobium japonicum]|uniref:hypothetical protein n=1 Tax=Bradyrhizobium japonicum TaxID=375 RepID=UPI002227451A|nr:hypothetical protein [Bradyrhizobium japonicum]MCW2225773.1 hypothetical protein [Bradyrhizobium japonicum]MCW2340984.1 hypothetical protein [Bradyrhizobium japonicum]